MDSQRPGQLLLTSSALQPAVENMPEYNDQWKIKHTATHIVQTISGDHTVFYCVSIWVLSREYGGRSVKLAKNSIYFKV
jgi:hypothetical protein